MFKLFFAQASRAFVWLLDLYGVPAMKAEYSSFYLWFQLRVDCRRAKEDEEEDGEMRGFSTTVKIWIPYA